MLYVIIHLNATESAVFLFLFCFRTLFKVTPAYLKIDGVNLQSWCCLQNCLSSFKQLYLHKISVEIIRATLWSHRGSRALFHWGKRLRSTAGEARLTPEPARCELWDVARGKGVESPANHLFSIIILQVCWLYDRFWDMSYVACY